MKFGFYSPAWPGILTANGITTSTYNLVTGLRALGHCAVVVADEIEVPSPDVFKVDSWAPWSALDKFAYRLGIRHPANDKRKLAMVRSIQRVVKTVKLDAFFMEESFGVAADVQAALTIPVGVFLRGPFFIHKTVSPLEIGHLINKGRETAEGNAIRKCYAVISPSHDVMERTISHYNLRPKWSLISPNPMGVKPPVDHDDLLPGRILFVGRFDTHKGGDLILEAFDRLVSSGSKAWLTYVGPDYGVPDPNSPGTVLRINEAISRLSPEAQARIDYRGKMTKGEIDALRQSHPVATVTSRFENFPNTITEAMASGQAIVASAVGGIPDIIQSGRTGLLVASNDVDALADALKRMVDDPPFAKRLGETARAYIADELSPLIVATKFAAFAEQVVADYKAKNRPSGISSMPP